MIRFPIIALAGLASGCLFGLVACGKQEVPDAAAPAAASATVPVAKVARPATPEEAALVPDGTQLVSPESGKAIQKNALTPALVYDGRLYFVCCAVCLKKCQTSPSLLQDTKPPNGYELRKLGGAES